MINEKLLYSNFWREISKVCTAIPARVVAVRDNLETMTVDVQPLVNNLRVDGTSQPWGTLMNVPLMFPSSDTSAFTFPVNPNDTVLLVFSQRNIETFQNGEGSPLDPNNHAKFDQNDAIAIAGLFPKSKSINRKVNRTLPHDTKDAVVAHNIGQDNEVEIRFKPDGSLRIISPTKVYVESPTIEAVTETLNVGVSGNATVDSPTTTWNGNITLNGSLNQSGTFTLDGINMNSHTHMILENNNTLIPHPTEVPQ